MSVRPQTRPAAAGVRGWYARHRADVLLAAVLLLLAAPVVQAMQTQQASRWALTAAVWETASVRVDDYEHILGMDRAERAGHIYSDKAPGQPLAAVPAFALYRAVGGEPGTVARMVDNLGLWWLSLWTSAVPVAALAVLMRRTAARVAEPRAAIAAALALATGTMLLPFSTLLFGHVLAALLAFVAFVLAQRPAVGPGASEVSAARLFAAGLIVGAGVLVEYTVAIVAAILLVGLAVRVRRRAAAFVAGGVGPALLLGLYNTLAFGGPTTFGYERSPHFPGHQTGLVGVQLPDPLMFLTVTFGERGLFTMTPVVVAGVVGLVLLLRQRDRGVRWGAAVSLAVFGGFVLVQSGWGGATGGASPGARYVVPSLPFLTLGVAWAFQRRPLPTALAAGAGTAVMALATFTRPLAQPTEAFALARWLQLAAEGAHAQTLPILATGSPWALLPPIAFAAGLAARLLAVPEPRGQLDGG